MKTFGIELGLVLRKKLRNCNPEVGSRVCTIIPRQLVFRQLVRRLKQKPFSDVARFHDREVPQQIAMAGRQVRPGGVFAARVDPLVQVATSQRPVRTGVVVRSHELLTGIERIRDRGPILIGPGNVRCRPES